MAQTLQPLERIASLELTDDLFRAYLERLQLAASSLAPSRATLFELHQRHYESMPFENLSVFLEDGVDLTIEAIADKMCRPGSRRGGYCFEHTKLFAAVLKKIGFRFEPKEARVWNDDGDGSNRPHPPGRSHLVLNVAVNDSDDVFLCDVGFARTAPVVPIRIGSDDVLDHDGHPKAQLRTARHTTEFYKQDIYELWYMEEGKPWKRGYSFDANAAYEFVDCQSANLMVHSYPGSMFASTVLVDSRRGDFHRQLFGLSLRENGKELEQIASSGALRRCIRENFGMDISNGDAAAIYGIITAEGVPRKWDLLLQQRSRARGRLRPPRAVPGRLAAALGAASLLALLALRHRRAA